MELQKPNSEKEKMLEEIKSILDKENLLDRKIPLQNRYEIATQNKEVRDIFNLHKPIITDLTKTLKIENNGKL